MKVQPRQQLLEIWEATLRNSWDDGRWVTGGRFESNVIADAEQLLCLLLPATKVPAFNLDRPDQTGERMVQALRKIGTATDIPRTLTRILTDYFLRYTDETGTPTFAGAGYFDLEDEGAQASAEQREIPIVDAFAVSVTLSLATLGFVRVFSRSVTREDVRAQLRVLEELASTRLSAAMVSLLRSFAVHVFPVDSPEGRSLCDMANQSRMPRRTVVSQLQRELRETAASFREVLIGSGQTPDLEQPDRLFECGWSWSVVDKAPDIETSEKIGIQPDGVAEDKPYLYFTVVALDAVEDLFSERTRVLGLLNEEQQRLSRALQLRWDLTRTYWAKVATFGDGKKWPLESLPWRTTDRDESDYYTLQVTSLAVKGLQQQRGTDADLSRVGEVLITLAERARITSRPVGEDASLRLHYPGIRLRLLGSELSGREGEGPLLIWQVPEFAALLFSRAATIASLLSEADDRSVLLDLGDRVWEHLYQRRIDRGTPAGLWDQPVRIFPGLHEGELGASWYFTARVVTALVTLANVLDRPPARNEELIPLAMHLIREAEQIYDRELLTGGAEAGPTLRETLRGVQVTLRRAREIVDTRPGTAQALAGQALLSLDKLAAARLDVFTEG